MKTTADEVDKAYNVVRYFMLIIMTGIFFGIIIYYSAKQREAMREMHEERMRYRALAAEIQREKRDLKSKIHELQRREKALEERANLN